METQPVAQLVEHRQQFPALAHKRYFNYGGQGPLPQAALDAIQAAYEQMQTLGPFSTAAGHWATQQVEQCRSAIANNLHVSPHTITLTDSVSTGCNIGLWGLNWQRGDHILLTDCEHPSVFATTQQLHRRFGIEFSTCPILNPLNDRDLVTTIVEHLRPQTRMLVLSHVLWNTGQVLPLAAIARACRQQQPHLVILVDAAQSIGVLPLNLSELDIDCYAFTGHKWWCGPDGLGGLYVNPKTLERLEPTYMGWRGIRTDASGFPMGWHPDSRRYEIATSAYPLFSGLCQALATLNQWGSAQVRYQHLCALSQQLWTQLNTLPHVHCLLPTPPQAGLVSFQIQGQDHQQLVYQLEQQHLMVRLIANPNCIRACTHYLTLETEIDQLVSALSAIVS